MAKKVTKNRKQAEQAAAKRRHLRIVAGIIMVAAAAGLACGGLVWYQHDQKAQQQAPDSADYADVLQSYYTAVFAADGQTLTQLMAPPEYWTYYMETYNKTEEDVIDSFAEGCSNTVFTMTVLSLLLAAPLGIFSAIYLVEYANKRGTLVGLIRITAETLSGIPSIVYGLFGMLFFTKTLKMGYSMMSGACTLAIMILPLIMRTAEEALKSVPDSYREASFGLGAGKLRTIFKIVLPSAVPGILSGVILATGRVVGETAALLFTAGTIAKVAGLMDSGRTLAVHMYALSSEGLYMNQMYATGVILMLIVLLINGCSGMIAKKIAKK